MLTSWMLILLKGVDTPRNRASVGTDPGAKSFPLNGVQKMNIGFAKSAWSCFSASILFSLVLFFGSPKATLGQASPGVSENEIIIGSCSALEGPSHFLGQQTVTGAKAYFNSVNDEGGVNGRKLKLISAD